MEKRENTGGCRRGRAGADTHGRRRRRPLHTIIYLLSTSVAAEAVGASAPPPSTSKAKALPIGNATPLAAVTAVIVAAVVVGAATRTPLRTALLVRAPPPRVHAPSRRGPRTAAAAAARIFLLIV